MWAWVLRLAGATSPLVVLLFSQESVPTEPQSRTPTLRVAVRGLARPPRRTPQVLQHFKAPTKRVLCGPC